MDRIDRQTFTTGSNNELAGQNAASVFVLISNSQRETYKLVQHSSYQGFKGPEALSRTSADITVTSGKTVSCIVL